MTTYSLDIAVTIGAAILSIWAGFLFHRLNGATVHNRPCKHKNRFAVIALLVALICITTMVLSIDWIEEDHAQKIGLFTDFMWTVVELLSLAVFAMVMWSMSRVVHRSEIKIVRLAIDNFLAKLKISMR